MSLRQRFVPLFVRRALVAALPLVASFVSSRAHAGDVEAAKAAYDQATHAYKQGRFEEATALFGKADDLSPSAAALEAALRAARRADKATLVLEVVRRAGRRDVGDGLRTLLDEAKSEYEGRVGKIRVECARCEPLVDGKPWQAQKPRTADAGYHVVQIAAGDDAERRLVSVVAGKTTRVVFGGGSDAPKEGAAAPTPAAAAAPEIRGLSRGWFWAGAGATGILGALAVASAVDTANKHTAYLAAPTSQGAADGAAAQTRTHVLFGFASAALVSTAVMGIFAIRWKDPDAPRSLIGAVAPTLGGAAMRLEGRF